MTTSALVQCCSPHGAVFAIWCWLTDLCSASVLMLWRGFAFIIENRQHCYKVGHGNILFICKQIKGVSISLEFIKNYLMYHIGFKMFQCYSNIILFSLCQKHLTIVINQWIAKIDWLLSFSFNKILQNYIKQIEKSFPFYNKSCNLINYFVSIRFENKLWANVYWKANFKS